MERTYVLQTSNSYLPYFDMSVQFPEIVDFSEIREVQKYFFWEINNLGKLYRHIQIFIL